MIVKCKNIIIIDCYNMYNMKCSSSLYKAKQSVVRSLCKKRVLHVYCFSLDHLVAVQCEVDTSLSK